MPLIYNEITGEFEEVEEISQNHIDYTDELCNFIKCGDIILGKTTIRDLSQMGVKFTYELYGYLAHNNGYSIWFDSVRGIANSISWCYNSKEDKYPISTWEFDKKRTFNDWRNFFESKGWKCEKLSDPNLVRIVVFWHYYRTSLEYSIPGRNIIVDVDLYGFSKERVQNNSEALWNLECMCRSVNFSTDLSKEIDFLDLLVDPSEKFLSFNDDKTSVIKCAKEATGKINIPNGVVCIEKEAFKDCVNIEYISMPDTVATLEDSCFLGCKNLVQIELPKNLVTIQSNVFKDCISLKNVEIGPYVKEIGHGAFSHCCSMSHITIPQNVSCFGGRCYPEIFIENDNHSLASVNGLLYDKTTKRLLCVPEKIAEGDITIPAVISSISGFVIPSFTHINSVTIEQGVKRIERNAFWGGEIDTLVIPESMEQIREDAFGYCKIKELHILIKDIENVEISPKAFDLSQKNKCKLFIPGISFSKYKSDRRFKGFAEVLPIPGTEKDVAFSYMKISDDGETILEVDEDASGRFEIPSGIKTVGAYSFSGNMKITEIVIPASVKVIDDCAFRLCTNLERIHMPDSLEWIGRGAFDCCNRLKVDRIPKNVETIKERAFYGCSIDGWIHRNIHCIEPQAFSGDIKIDAGNQHFVYTEGCLLSKDKTTLYSVINPDTTLEHTTPNNLKKIANKAYYQWCFLTIMVNDSVDAIGDLAFGETSMLHSLHIGSGVRTIGSEILKSSGAYNLYLHVDNINDVKIAIDAFFSFDTSRCNLYVKGNVINDFVEHPLFSSFKEISPIPGTEIVEIAPIDSKMVADCFIYPFGRKQYRFSYMEHIPFDKLIQGVSTKPISKTWDQVWSMFIDSNYRILGMQVLSLHYYHNQWNDKDCRHTIQLELRHKGVLYSQRQIEVFLQSLSEHLLVYGMNLSVYQTKLTKELKAKAEFDGVGYFIENKEKGKITITIKKI